VSRIPIRLRLMLPFAFAMAAVLAATGAFVYVRVGDQLLASLDSNLRAQLAEVRTNARDEHSLVDPDASDGVTVAAIELPSGAPVARTPDTLRGIPVRPGLVRKTLFTTSIPGLRGRWRVGEMPSTVAGRRVVIAVARPLAARHETLDRLGHEFLFAAPVALVLAALAGYGLAAAALRPVEAMRRRAAAVTAAEPGLRLPVPPARDEIHALALTLNDMLARLEAAFEHERRFLSDASHELRTPLSLLRAELELALLRPRSHAELEAAVRSAAEETERLSRLAEDLLLIARADQGALPLRRVEVDTGDVLRRVAERLAPQARAHGRTIVVTDEAPTLLDADPDRLEQALGNLVENAILHGAGPITLSARTRDGLVELHVTDEGSGFPEDFLPRAFDRFSRSDDARSHGGTGLGLSIVQLVADAHAGTAGARNRAVGGADVWIAVPAAAVGSRRGSLSPA
jgi:signal transduction histidine kinase